MLQLYDLKAHQRNKVGWTASQKVWPSDISRIIPATQDAFSPDTRLINWLLTDCEENSNKHVKKCLRTTWPPPRFSRKTSKYHWQLKKLPQLASDGERMDETEGIKHFEGGLFLVKHYSYLLYQNIFILLFFKMIYIYSQYNHFLFSHPPVYFSFTPVCFRSHMKSSQLQYLSHIHTQSWWKTTVLRYVTIIS